MSDVLRKLEQAAKGRSLVSDAAWALLGNLKAYLKAPHPMWGRFIARDIERLKAAMLAEQKGHLQ